MQKSMSNTAQKMKFSIKDFFSKCEQIRRRLRICSQLLKKSLMENFIFCEVQIATAIQRLYSILLVSVSVKPPSPVRIERNFSRLSPLNARVGLM